MPTLHLFEGYGVELEYMIVDAKTLRVLPVTDQVLKAFHGEFIDEIDNGQISWSNELALHVIELKTNGPARSLDELADLFSENVRKINGLLEPLGGKLMPTAMHPFMNPDAEMKLWPHERNEIYEKYNSIFDCRGHGWANLQSVHLNLPFAGDAEFARLHAAIRLVLPILPGLAASSPLMDGKYSGLKDSRLEVYQHNQKRVPSISGKVIPERVFSQKDYQEQILQKNYRDIAPFDPDGLLQHEWLNSRGAIARFERNAIEIRVLDIQECPAADLAILKIITSTIKKLVAENWQPLSAQQQWSEDDLLAIFKKCVAEGEEAEINRVDYLSLFGFEGDTATARELWQHLIEKAEDISEADRSVLDTIIAQGTLATRITTAIGEEPHSDKVHDIYNMLADCLAENKPFLAIFA